MPVIPRRRAQARARAGGFQKPSEPNYWRRALGKGWTPERRARQAALIRTWRPWEKSTGPRTPEGKARTARNGDKGGAWKSDRELLRELWRILAEQREALAELTSEVQGLRFDRPSSKCGNDAAGQPP